MRAVVPRGYMRVRFTPGIGWEGKCPTCPKGEDWWPLPEDPRDEESAWRTDNLTRCRACLREEDRRKQRIAYIRSPEYQNARAARYREENREVLRLKMRARYEENKKNPEWLERRRAETREATRRYRARKKEQAA